MGWLGPGHWQRIRRRGGGVPFTGQHQERKTGDPFGPVCQGLESKDRRSLSDGPKVTSPPQGSRPPEPSGVRLHILHASFLLYRETSTKKTKKQNMAVERGREGRTKSQPVTPVCFSAVVAVLVQFSPVQAARLKRTRVEKRDKQAGKTQNCKNKCCNFICCFTVNGHWLPAGPELILLIFYIIKAVKSGYKKLNKSTLLSFLTSVCHLI